MPALKIVLAFFFISTCCCVIIFCQVAKFFCSIKVLFSIRLTLVVNNLKLNSIARFNLIVSLAYKVIIHLFVISKIKITSLKTRFICFCFLLIPEQSKVRQILLSLFANSIKSLLIPSADCGMYFVVFLIQTPPKILRTLPNETIAGKILKIFVCKRIVLHIDFSG